MNFADIEKPSQMLSTASAPFCFRCGRPHPHHSLLTVLNPSPPNGEERRVYFVGSEEKEAFFAMTPEEKTDYLAQKNRAAYEQNAAAQAAARDAAEAEYEARYASLSDEQALQKQSEEFRQMIEAPRDTFNFRYAVLMPDDVEWQDKAHEFLEAIQEEAEGPTPDTLEVSIRYEKGIKSATVTGNGKEIIGADIQEISLAPVNVLFYPIKIGQGFGFAIKRRGCYYRAALSGLLAPTLHKQITERNARNGWDLPDELREIEPQKNPLEIGKSRPLLPQTLPHPTFMEARQFASAISDGRDGRHWGEVQGALALLHCPPKANHQTRFEPNGTLLNWWGISGAQPQHLYSELARLDFDAVILFQVTLSAILHTEKARWSEVSLDSIIKMIGRDSDARRSTKAREEWRGKVWRWLVLFDSMTVHGARPGRWREPGSKGEKRSQMGTQTLHSSDPLIRIVGTRDTEQGTFDGSAPPKEVSIVPGDWLMKFHGNREMLSEMGDVLKIAQISRGKPSGAWAACAGLMLNQLWREEATRATKGRNSRGKENKSEVLHFRPFTRRELLAETVRSDYDVDTILNDPKSSHRARGYWTQAVKELKKCGVIGHYRELAVKLGRDWREEWLDQPLEIRPGTETLADALAINKSAEAARRRGRAKSAKKELPKP